MVLRSQPAPSSASKMRFSVGQSLCASPSGSSTSWTRRVAAPQRGGEAIGIAAARRSCCVTITAVAPTRQAVEAVGPRRAGRRRSGCRSCARRDRCRRVAKCVQSMRAVYERPGALSASRRGVDRRRDASTDRRARQLELHQDHVDQRRHRGPAGLDDEVRRLAVQRVALGDTARAGARSGSATCSKRPLGVVAQPPEQFLRRRAQVDDVVCVACSARGSPSRSTAPPPVASTPLRPCGRSAMSCCSMSRNASSPSRSKKSRIGHADALLDLGSESTKVTPSRRAR